jgi:hypothetical protein
LSEVTTQSLTSLQQRLVKIGDHLIKHARYYWLLLAKSHLTTAALRQLAAETESETQNRNPG